MNQGLSLFGGRCYRPAATKPAVCATAPERASDAQPQRCAFAESGAANAVFRYDPSRENGFQESPQTFLKPEI